MLAAAKELEKLSEMIDVDAIVLPPEARAAAD